MLNVICYMLYVECYMLYVECCIVKGVIKKINYDFEVQ
jgi:hypothetical protein